jgi:5-(carboxyamino)imidazole ribonucleotide mutase
MDQGISIMSKQSDTPVSIIMGSDSDWSTMKAAAEILKQFDVAFEAKVISAHRTPEDMADFAKNACAKGIKVIIAGAGGAAHLPGMVAGHTTLPVIGVPVKSSHLNGIDSLLSIVQMPKGVPVATMAIGNAENAGLYALRILGIEDKKIHKALEEFHQKQAEESRKKTENLIY